MTEGYMQLANWCMQLVCRVVMSRVDPVPVRRSDGDPSGSGTGPWRVRHWMPCLAILVCGCAQERAPGGSAREPTLTEEPAAALTPERTEK